MKRFIHILLAAALIAAALATALTLPASAELRSVTVRMTDGSLKSVVVDVPEGATLQDILSLVPGEPVSWEPVPPPAPAPKPPTSQTEQAPPTAPPADPAPEAPATSPTATQAPEGAPVARQPLPGSRIVPEQGLKRRSRVKPKLVLKGEGRPKARRKVETRRRHRAPAPRLRNNDGSPSPSNPGFVDALPGPSYATGVPNFVIRKFRVPVFLLPIYQAAGIQYGVRWEVLAAINEIETDYGRNLNVSSAGALGWMQFMPSTWKMYGVDANKDGKKDPFNPVDAIFASARYLKAAGYEKDARRAVFAYNHADWYVDSVMLRAKLIAGVPADLVGSLTGLTEGRFPVAARARYADDLKEQKSKRVGVGKNAANVIESDENRRSIAIYAKRGAPVVATNDGQVKKIGQTAKLGRYVILQDVYGNRYMYSGLGSVARYYPIAKEDAASSSVTSTHVLKANRDPRPKAPASAGRQPVKKERRAVQAPATEDRGPTTVKRRLFAHPDMPESRDNGGYEQLLDIQSESGGLGTYEGYARPVRIDPKRFTLRRLRPGAHVIAGTPLGEVGTPDEGKAPHVDFGIRPAGKGAPRIDPKPILDGWKLLEATSIYRASGKNALRDGSGSYSIGQIILMPKAALQKRVLADERIDIYQCGRENIAAGQIDRRVLATLEYLAESGLRPSVSSLKCGHGLMTASGNVSEHSSGNAVDIASINGIPILGHQEKGGITEVTVRRLMRLQGTLRPHQIISLLDLGQNSMALSDHYNHIHVGFQPRYGANTKLSAQARAVLRPGQWPQLLKRLNDIQNPVVPTKPSKYAIPVRKLKPVGKLGR
jgi:transglycosylase-like protein with SLT domain